MSITELTARVQAAGKSRDHSQRIQLLQKAHVLNAQGKIDTRFFPSEKTSPNPNK
jgi:hypothetical protein